MVDIDSVETFCFEKAKPTKYIHKKPPPAEAC